MKHDRVMHDKVMHDFILPILVLTLICFAVSGALAFMDSITQPVIAEAASDRTKTIMNAKIPAAEGFEEIDISGLFNSRFTMEAYKSTNDVGYVIIKGANGFKSEVIIICGIDNDGKIIAVSVLSHKETAGYGNKMEEASFIDPFIGKDKRLDGVDTVTGATYSTRAFIDAVNEAFEIYEIVKGVR